MNAIERAVAICGSQAELARRLAVKQAYVWNWLNRAKGRVPAEYCIAIEQQTGGVVTRYELRPDVFGSSPSEAAPAA